MRIRESDQIILTRAVGSGFALLTWIGLAKTDPSSRAQSFIGAMVQVPRW
jgi:hypothetical protein